MLREENRRLREQLNALVGVAGGVIWLDNNIHNYGSDEWRGYFKAVLRDARAALAKVRGAPPTSSPTSHSHTWSLPTGAGVYRCMTCGAEATRLSSEDDPFLPIGHPTC